MEDHSIAMKVRVESSRIVKPTYEGIPPSTSEHMPFSVFDKVTIDAHFAFLYAYRPPTPPNSVMESGLAKVLAAYRALAGRLGEDAEGNPIILLNDEGVRFVEASVDTTHDKAMQVQHDPSPAWLNLQPEDGGEELFQVQLTRFTCGTLVVGFSMYHRVADGPAIANFLVAWCRACCGLDIGPLPLHDRAMFNKSRDSPQIKFQHRGVEFTTERKTSAAGEGGTLNDNGNVAIHKAHFSREFLNTLKAKASFGSKQRYSTFECLMAHLWKTITRARRLPGNQQTHVRISMNGRQRLSPRVPDEYFGNLILWAYPKTKVRELISRPLRYVAELIHNEIAKVDDSYYKSFIDFANSEDAKGLIAADDPEDWVLSPNVDVDCWLRFPICDMDLGGVSPFYFIPSYYPVEGQLFIVPSFTEGDHGSMDAYVALFEDDMASFKRMCYSLDQDNMAGQTYGREKYKNLPSSYMQIPLWERTSSSPFSSTSLCSPGNHLMISSTVLSPKALI
ncbi:agmatine coumaroyltransferase-2-like isoform X1 [Typha angustifolia]|uniref:agmatine coumaroyltransferase-2-like isoform X1 n=1 Tax=Typha angustifolia TaxID=59011 RepID=UPI003C2EB834